MTREERNTKLKHFITCLKCEVSGKECDANCHVQYEAGNMGEIIENLEAISKALEQEPKTGHWINGDCEGGNCSICGEYYALYPESGDFNYCPNCGAKMVEPQESEERK